MAMYYTNAASPLPAGATGAVAYTTKLEDNVNPLGLNVVYLPDPRVVVEEGKPKPQPPLCARVTTLALISLALAFNIVVLALLSASLAKGWGYSVNSDYEGRSMVANILAVCAIVETAFSLITLIVCVVMTAVAPRRVMANPTTHAMNCLCATVFILAACSIIAVCAFAVNMDAPENTDFAAACTVIAAISSAFKFAYFVDLIVVKCCCKPEVPSTD